MPEAHIHDPISLQQISALFAESLCYGLYLFSCAFCLVALLSTENPSRWRSLSEMRWIMLLAWLVLLLNCSLNLALGLYRNLDAFIYSTDPEKVFRTAGNWINLTKTFTTLIQPLIGDLILIYRVYVVYKHKRILVLPPIIFWIANLAMAIRAIQLQAETLKLGSIHDSPVTPWLVAFWTLTVSQTLYSTSLIIWRLWRADHTNQEHGYQSAETLPGPSRLQKIIRSVAESGILYTAATFVVLFCQALKSDAIYVASAIEIMVVGIAFNLIIIRARMQEKSKLNRSPDAPTLSLAFMRHQDSTMGTIRTSGSHSLVYELDFPSQSRIKTHTEDIEMVSMNADDDYVAERHDHPTTSQRH